MERSRLPLYLLLPLAAVWAWAAWNPSFRHDWLLEQLLVFITLPMVAFIHWKRGISNVSTCLLFVFYCMHIVGSHWTYSNVPFGYGWFGSERNQYDRLVHLMYGFLLVYPIREALQWRPDVRGAWAWFLAVQFIVATSALYEIIEWLTVAITAPDLGAAFLGTQGDEFDAVKDMALAGAGAIVAAFAWWAIEANSGLREASAPQS